MALCYYNLEDFVALESLVKSLSDTTPLLPIIAEQFASVGMCHQAVAAFLKVVNRKIDNCEKWVMKFLCLLVLSKYHACFQSTLKSGVLKPLWQEKRLKHTIKIFLFNSTIRLHIDLKFLITVSMGLLIFWNMHCSVKTILFRKLKQ